MSVAPQLLFVYGTLMSGLNCAMGRSERARLAQEARSLGAATVPGRLYDLGAYPGFVTTDDTVTRVVGEVLSLTDAATTLEWLDAYEGIGAHRHEDRQHDGQRAEADEYDRVIVRVRLGDETGLPAWVYRYRGPVADLPWLREGRWIPAA